MLTYRQTIRHYHQLGAYNCGPVALSCIFDTSLQYLENLVKCDEHKGTFTSVAYLALKKEGVDCNLATINSDYNNLLWSLERSSYRWPIYLGCHFVQQGARGRPSNRHHALLLANGLIYDGNSHREEPIEAVRQNFNKRFIIKDAIIFNHELPNWRVNLEFV